jgi:hypothetical protein
MPRTSHPQPIPCRLIASSSPESHFVNEFSLDVQRLRTTFGVPSCGRCCLLHFYFGSILSRDWRAKWACTSRVFNPHPGAIQRARAPVLLFVVPGFITMDFRRVAVCWNWRNCTQSTTQPLQTPRRLIQVMDLFGYDDERFDHALGCNVNRDISVFNALCIEPVYRMGLCSSRTSTGVRRTRRRIMTDHTLDFRSVYYDWQ